MHYNAQSIRSLGTIMGIWAHPDDETWSSAGIMYTARSQDQRVVCVTATRGDAGKTADETRWPQARLKDIRTSELEAALAVLGVEEQCWLEYQDGTLASTNATQAVARLTALCEEIRPNTILTFEPRGITGHEDHQTISRWAVEAATRVVPSAAVFGAVELREKYDAYGKQFDEAFDIYFNTDMPVLVSKEEAALYYELPQDVLNAKLKSLRAHASQTTIMFANADMARHLHDTAASEHFIRLR